MSNLAQPLSAYLAASPHAVMKASLDLGFGRSAKIWQNRDARVRYEAPVDHTFSYYVSGGSGTRRLDAGQSHEAQGWQGAVCLMPQGQSSEWEITDAFEFIHIHLPDDELRLAYGQTFDRDARMLELADLTYADAPELVAPFQMLLSATREGYGLQAEEATTELIARIFSGRRFWHQLPGAISGGLAPRKLRHLKDYIEARLDQPIHLRDLADEVGLSEFHLQRSFRASSGSSPHRFLLHRRIERAKGLIRKGEPLAQIADACGFDSQSHLSRAFKSATGMPPGSYREALRQG